MGWQGKCNHQNTGGGKSTPVVRFTLNIKCLKLNYQERGRNKKGKKRKGRRDGGENMEERKGRRDKEERMKFMFFFVVPIGIPIILPFHMGSCD